jgi:ADP-heptose:LPS heptosyltransferase
MAAMKRKYPHATLVFAGPRKNYELFAGDPHVHHAEVSYRRGGIRERLGVWEGLKKIASAPDTIVIDSDSRLTQLGLLPVCDDERYYFFESRAYGSDGSESLSSLAAKWAQEIFGIRGMKPYLALQGACPRGSHIAVSLGVGENMAKRLPDPFEEELLKALAATGAPLAIDQGAGGEEAARVAAALERSGVQAALWDGSFAGFARIIASSALYVGYDSAGQHVAAASSTPLISIFGGFPAPRMFERWRPSGERCTVIRVEKPDVDDVLKQVKAALAERR